MENIKGLITPKEAKTLNDEFTPRCELVSRDITKRPDNRSSWWSIDDLEKYLAHAKAQAKKLGHELNGIRVYCGAYPEQDGKPGYSTAFMIPTADIPQGKGGGGGGNSDIPGADGFNFGGPGNPPGSGYPQE